MKYIKQTKKIYKIKNQIIKLTKNKKILMIYIKKQNPKNKKLMIKLLNKTRIKNPQILLI